MMPFMAALPITATYLSPGEVFPRSSVDCTRQRQIPNHPSGRGATLEHGRHAHSSEIKPLAGLERLAKDYPEF